MNYYIAQTTIVWYIYCTVQQINHKCDCGVQNMNNLSEFKTEIEYEDELMNVEIQFLYEPAHPEILEKETWDSVRVYKDRLPLPMTPKLEEIADREIANYIKVQVWDSIIDHFAFNSMGY